MCLPHPHPFTNMSPPDAPDRHPECSGSLEEDPSQVLFNCSWFGAYPTPTLLWGDSQDVGGGAVEGDLLVSQEADSLVMRRNRSQLHEGLTLKCNGHHQTLPARGEKACSFTLSKCPCSELEMLLLLLELRSVGWAPLRSAGLLKTWAFVKCRVTCWGHVQN